MSHKQLDVMFINICPVIQSTSFEETSQTHAGGNSMTDSSKPSLDDQQRGTSLHAVVIDTTELTLKHICFQRTRGIADKTILHAAFQIILSYHW